MSKPDLWYSPQGRVCEVAAMNADRVVYQYKWGPNAKWGTVSREYWDANYSKEKPNEAPKPTGVFGSRPSGVRS